MTNWRTWRRLRSAFAAFALIAGCGTADVVPEHSQSPSPPAALSGATPGAATGDVSITLVGAEPLPGATLSGCGGSAAGLARPASG